MPDPQLRFHKPAALTILKSSKSNMISAAIRRGMEDMKNKPVINKTSEEKEETYYEVENSYYKETRSEALDRSRRANIPMPSYKYFKSDT